MPAQRAQSRCNLSYPEAWCAQMCRVSGEDDSADGSFVYRRDYACCVFLGNSVEEASCSRRHDPHSIALATSPTSTDSDGSWLIPPGVRKKIIADLTFSANIMASWPAPLIMR